ncbi:MAG: hypothetical protein JRE24_12345 [Deltaproteobacteria bacterium]|nr:hypothetical protein [Deltaproteobacteria bacterium]
MKRSRVRLSTFPLMMVTLLFGLFIFSPYSWAQPASFTLDFETGDLRG